MAKNSMKPQIRFKGFTDAWEQRKVGELIEDYVEKTIIQNQYPVLTSSQQYGIVRQEEYFADRQVTTSDNIGYYVLPLGYFTYRSRSDTDLFVFNRNNLIDKGIISYYYPVFAPKSCDSNFLLRRLNYGIRHQLAMVAEGTGQKVLSHDKFKKMVLDVPSLQEQRQIGFIFEQIDNLITLHQRKYEKFVNIKKALLEKMFPQGDEKVPRIRFKGFTDAWEQRKVQDVADRYDNLRIPVAANLRVSGNIPYYGANGIQDYVNGFTHEGEFVLVAEDGANDLKNYPVQHVQGRIWVNNHAHVLQGKPALMNNLFLAYSLHRADIASFLVGGSRAKLNADTLMTLELLLPSVEEQTKIGRNLAAVDNLITLHQRQVEKLKNIKSALLEKMFV